MSVPDWVKDSVFYQIFPDRFANGDPANDPPNVQPWGSPPTVHGFQGGDLVGITRRLDYLVDLGITGIYLNPIFLSASTHRYDTMDYLRIDPKLGDLDDFHALLSAAHEKNIRVILDGVFNHCSRGFFAFNDILENGSYSPYLDWFHVRRLPLRAYEPGHARNYLAWWGIKSLPKFNTGNPAVRRYLLNVARYWIEQGADGWRLDVPNEINDDSFWAEFREVVYNANPEAYTVGEIWEANPRWANDQHFDGLMNYPVRIAIQQFIDGKITAAQFSGQVESFLALYPRENGYAMYNLLGSHDTERILTFFNGDQRKVKLAFLFLFTYPGVPSIYYGDEIGLRGGKDPDCRGAFPWDQSQWAEDLHSWVKQLVALRRKTAVLRRGDFQPLVAQENSQVYAFIRAEGNERVLVVLNAAETPATLRVPVAALGNATGHPLHSLLDQRPVVSEGDNITVALEPFSGDILA